jgi:hypothetical protein
VLSCSTPILRAFYELDVLNPAGYAFIGVVVIVWAFLLKGLWRLGKIEPLLRRFGVWD